ncbi:MULTISPECIES: hybrid sensor histidine kinase/response regulator [Pseudanabaena]|uniref:hybrid sensor histidine kinase/response regulator n=1 Tax=Pseudanabaena TaxID=1152 RepID=UPI0024785A45|nr:MULTISPECIES: hybrid sensor histidine kinase/response regulator [Pseudanabaena]MEA5486480.1 hybrid sensor histidine kinase/response regulator [Pseudanabaena sp. CCNP1317]WGS72743.1 hybrid sensor histidine kinase/response regulator [Pseudanabaena galeata CCNP1313]
MTNKPTIICVDDERNVLLMLRNQLMHFFSDCKIEIAESGNEALEVIEEILSNGGDVALVIADQIMPKMKGDEFLIEVHHHHPQILKVMLTGQANVEDIGNVVNRGNLYRFISKPWNETDLRLTVAEALRRYEQDKQLAKHQVALEQTNLELIELNANLESANVELKRVSKLKDEFLSMMNHELRTPFNAILGMSECLLEEIYGSINPSQKDAIALIQSSSNHLLKLINDILDISKLTTGLVELDIESVPIADLCNSCLDFVKQQALKKQIQITINIYPDIKFFEADPIRIRQVLINLLENAIKFTPTGGAVSMEVKMDQPDSKQITSSGITKTSDSLEQGANHQEVLNINSWIYFAITDTGLGISPSDQNRLFQPFLQIDSGLNRNYEGIGIGLAIVKQIVELHNGYVDLNSQLGHGSCFTVGIPLKA